MGCHIGHTAIEVPSSYAMAKRFATDVGFTELPKAKTVAGEDSPQQDEALYGKIATAIDGLPLA